MALKSERTTKVRVIKLLIIIPSFYLIFYLISGIMVAAFQLPIAAVGRMPFDWVYFNPAMGGVFLGVSFAIVPIGVCSHYPRSRFFDNTHYVHSSHCAQFCRCACRWACMGLRRDHMHPPFRAHLLRCVLLPPPIDTARTYQTV